VPESLKQAIKQEAHRLGFILVGVTTPDPPPHWSTYENWLTLGHHGEMAYLGNERARLCRAEPLCIMPECRSILVLGMRYPDPKTIPLHPELSSRGRIAAYSWGTDYHTLLPERLEVLADFIKEQVNHSISYRIYTDTGPILERDLAQRAGLGWIGKNTCLIAPGIGSYFFLAEILLDIEIPPDPPFETDHCGTCTRCIQACPTGCILPNRTLDARRCISYLTIELKGEIPLVLRPLLGNWIFGCDICQMVCPWNRFASSDVEPQFTSQDIAIQPMLAEEILLSQDMFNHKFRTSPIRRARRRGYLRNIAVAIGNACEPASIPAIEQIQQDPEPLIRQHARWALEQIKGKME